MAKSAPKSDGPSAIGRMYEATSTNLTKERSFYALISASCLVYGCIAIPAVAIAGGGLAAAFISPFPLIAAIMLVVLARKEAIERRSRAMTQTPRVEINLQIPPDQDPQLFLQVLLFRLKDIERDHGENIEISVPFPILSWLAQKNSHNSKLPVKTVEHQTSSLEQVRHSEEGMR